MEGFHANSSFFVFLVFRTSRSFFFGDKDPSCVVIADILHDGSDKVHVPDEFAALDEFS